MGIAVVDGHESHTSYLQHCSGCLERTLHLEAGDRIQFYHRQVTLMCCLARLAAVNRFVFSWIMTATARGG